MNRNFAELVEKNPVVYRWCMAAILLLAAAVRAIHLACDTVLTRDGVTYIMMCQGRPLPFDWVPPLYLEMMKLLHACGASWEAAGRGISLTAGVLLIIPAMKIAEYCLQKRIWAVAFGILTAISPRSIDLSIAVQRDSLYLLESALAIFALLNGMRGKKICWGLAGFFVASAIYTRIEAFEFIGLYGIVFAVMLFQKKGQWRDLLPGCLLFWAAFLATMLICSLLLDGGIGVSAAHFFDYISRRKSVARWLLNY